MTEAEWLESEDPEAMLNLLKGRASRRKLRLFAVALCRRHRHMFVPETLGCLEVAEQFAEGRVGQKERREARDQAFRAPWHSDPAFAHRRGPAKACVAHSLARQAYEAAKSVAWLSKHIGVLSKTDWPENAYEMTEQGRRLIDWSSGKKEQVILQAAMLREIFGNPFRTVDIAPPCNNAAVVSLATKIYDDCAFDQMPELAIMLERGGSADERILNHCRGTNSHVRGCWVIDLLLGKQ